MVAVATTILPESIHANYGTRLKSLKLVLFQTPFLDRSRLPRVHLRLMLLFFSLFLFFNLNFLAGTIKTGKVIVATNEIVDSSSNLLTTPKTLVSYGAPISLLKASPKGSFLERVAGKKFLAIKSLADLATMEANGIDQHVIFTIAPTLLYFMDFLSADAKNAGLIAFMKPTNHYELLCIHQMRRSLDEERKRFIKSRLAY